MFFITWYCTNNLYNLDFVTTESSLWRGQYFLWWVVPDSWQIGRRKTGLVGRRHYWQLVEAQLWTTSVSIYSTTHNETQGAQAAISCTASRKGYCIQLEEDCTILCYLVWCLPTKIIRFLILCILAEKSNQRPHYQFYLLAVVFAYGIWFFLDYFK